MFLCFMDIVDDVVEEMFSTETVECDVLYPHLIDLDHNDFADDSIVSSQIQGPELKALPTHLKYVYLGYVNMLPVIISRELTLDQEDKLMDTLKMYKKAIGWIVDDIKGISSTLCRHQIALQKGAKPTRQPLRRLNRSMKEVVLKEIVKLHNVGIIYPISDSN